MNTEQQGILRTTIARMLQMPPVRVEAVDGAGEILLWFHADFADMIGLSPMNEAAEEHLRLLLPALMARWTRAAAATKRVWQQRDRLLRQWKAAMTVASTTPPVGATEEEEGKEGKKAGKGWKAPTQAVVEASYRNHPDYAAQNREVERSEEAFQACLGVIKALETAAQLLTAPQKE